MVLVKKRVAPNFTPVWSMLSRRVSTLLLMLRLPPLTLRDAASNVSTALRLAQEALVCWASERINRGTSNSVRLSMTAPCIQPFFCRNSSMVL